MSMFEKASRMKLRFDTPAGSLPVEDVWDLPLKQPTRGRNNRANLNDLAKSLHRELKNDEDMDFVDDVEKPNTALTLKFEIVKHIIGIRKTELEAAENMRKAKERKSRILEIIAEKEDESLKGKSTDELRALLSEL